MQYVGNMGWKLVATGGLSLSRTVDTRSFQRYMNRRKKDLEIWFVKMLLPRVLFFGNRRSWAKMVKRKTIAVVGPAPLDEDYSEVIDAHDVVIRVGLEHWPWQGTGTRTDVWVLDGQSSQEFLNLTLGYEKKTVRQCQKAPRELERVRKNLTAWIESDAGWVILKPNSRLRLSEIAKHQFFREFRESSTRCIVSRIPLFLKFRGLDKGSAKTHLNQVPRVLYELFLLRPKSVAVFGSDYYARAEKPYSPSSPSYEAVVRHPKAFIQGMLSSHPQLHQKRIVRWIQKRRGWPTGDSLFTQLTALEDEQFLKLYRDW